MMTIHGLFEDQVKRTPESTAVACGEARLTYRELHRRSNYLASVLLGRGLLPGDFVAVLLERSCEAIVSLLAILKAGGAYVALDPDYPKERLTIVLDDCEATCVISQSNLRAVLPIPDERCLLVDTVEWARELSTDFCGPDLDSRSLGYLIYTSGSTGRPKGVMIEHRSAVEFIDWSCQVFGRQDLRLTLASTSFCFDLSIFEVFVPLSAGGTVVLVRNILEWSQTQPRPEVSLINTVPSALNEILRDRLLPESVRVVNVAGEALLSPLVDKTFQAAPHLCAMYNLYGPSEDTTYSTFTAVYAGETPSIGKAVRNTFTYLVDGQGSLVAEGSEGELWIGGLGLARGYWERPGLTADRFRPDPFSGSAGSRVYCTGDLCRQRPDGNIDFLGRIDHQVKIRGHRIELGEVETALLLHPAVAHAVVVAQAGSDESAGKRLVAYVSLLPNTSVPPEYLRSELKRKLPSYMVPSLIVELDRLPLTPNGKIDRSRLPEPHWVSAPTSSAPLEGELEVQLAELWQDVLGIAVVGRDDNFFDLGGHSLSAMQLVSAVQRTFGLILPLRQVFETSRLRQMARFLGSALDAAPLSSKAASASWLPLSFGEQRLFFLAHFDPESPVYNLGAGVRLFGPLAAAILSRTIEILVARHETLRTRYVLQEGNPVRMVDPPEPFQLRTTEVLSWKEAEAIAADELRDRFDLERGPVFRFHLFRINDQHHFLSYAMHHIVSDAWSLELWAREQGEVYRSLLAEEQPALSPTVLSYSEYASWLIQNGNSPETKAQLDYWTAQLEGLSPLNLPTVFPRPAVADGKGAIHEFALTPNLTSELRALSSQQNVTLFMTLTAAFAVLLYRYSGQDDIAMGTPISGRNRTEFHDIFGYFLNTLVLRVRLSPDLSFSEVLAQVREVALNAYSNQDIPFDRIVEKLSPERDLSRTPLFQAVLVLQQAASKAWNLPDVRASVKEICNGTAKFDLSAYFTDEGDYLSGMLEYATSIFDADFAERLSLQMVHVLEQACRFLDMPLRDLEMLRESDRQRVLEEWNETEVRWSDTRSLAQMFEANAAEYPKKAAILEGDCQITYAEVNTRAAQIARLIQLEARGAERVAIRLTPGVDMIVAVLAVVKAGAAYVPIDPDYPMERQKFMLRDSHADVLITSQHLETMDADECRQVLVDHDLISSEPVPMPLSSGPTDPESLLYLIYTSGSTGLPKSVALPHRAMNNLVRWYWTKLRRGVRTLQFASLCFDIASLEIFSTLCSGGTLVLATQDVRRDISLLADLASTAKMEQLYLPVVVLDRLCQEFLRRRTSDLSVREIVTAGEQLQVTPAVREFCKINRCELHNQYGPSETHVVTALTLSGDPSSWPSTPSIGTPISNTVAYVVDSGLNLMPIGVPGELLLGGCNLAHGYWRRPEETARQFIPNPFDANSGTRLYKTGDICKWNLNGTLAFLGRLDHQVKIRGFRVEIDEVRAVLSTHPGVAEAAVLAIAEPNATSEKTLIAYVVPQSGSSPINPAEIREYLRSRLPDFMVPNLIAPLTALPLNGSGKLDRKRLPSAAQILASVERSPARSETEIQLADIWQDVFSFPEIGADDNFFDLGGHSLLAMRLRSRISDTFQVPVPLHFIFKYPILRDFAALLDKRLHEVAVSAT